MKQISGDLLDLLNEIAARQHPEIFPVTSSSVARLAPEQLLYLRDSLADELCATGLTESDEPNERGRRIEELIDALGRLQMR